MSRFHLSSMALVALALLTACSDDESPTGAAGTGASGGGGQGGAATGSGGTGGASACPVLALSQTHIYIPSIARFGSTELYNTPRFA